MTFFELNKYVFIIKNYQKYSLEGHVNRTSTPKSISFLLIYLAFMHLQFQNMISLDWISRFAFPLTKEYNNVNEEEVKKHHLMQINWQVVHLNKFL